MLYVASAVVTVGNIITNVTGLPKSLELLWWFLILLLFLCTCIASKTVFWNTNLVLGVVSLFVLLIYIFGCIQFSDFSKNAALSDKEGIYKWFDGGIIGFMVCLPFSSWWYVGIEGVLLVASDIVEVFMIPLNF